MLIRLLIVFAICLLILCVNGCKTVNVSNTTACQVGFDYSDNGVNEQNARALLSHYCICYDEELCK